MGKYDIVFGCGVGRRKDGIATFFRTPCLMTCVSDSDPDNGDCPLVIRSRRALVRIGVDFLGMLLCDLTVLVCSHSIPH